MIDEETAARLVRAARALVRKDPAEFAATLDIGLATLKRVEAGYPPSAAVLAKIAAGFETAGIEAIGPSADRPDLALGVVLRASADVGAEPPSMATDRSRKIKAPTGRGRKKV